MCKPPIAVPPYLPCWEALKKRRRVVHVDTFVKFDALLVYEGKNFVNFCTEFVKFALAAVCPENTYILSLITYQSYNLYSLCGRTQRAAPTDPARKEAERPCPKSPTKSPT